MSDSVAVRPKQLACGQEMFGGAQNTLQSSHRAESIFDYFMQLSADPVLSFRLALICRRFFPSGLFFHGFPATVCVFFPYSSADFLNVKKIRSPIERWIVSINLDEDGGRSQNSDAKDFVVVV